MMSGYIGLTQCGINVAVVDQDLARVILPLVVPVDGGLLLGLVLYHGHLGLGDGHTEPLHHAWLCSDQ